MQVRRLVQYVTERFAPNTHSDLAGEWGLYREEDVVWRVGSPPAKKTFCIDPGTTLHDLHIRNGEALELRRERGTVRVAVSKPARGILRIAVPMSQTCCPATYLEIVHALLCCIMRVYAVGVAVLTKGPSQTDKTVELLRRPEENLTKLADVIRHGEVREVQRDAAGRCSGL